MNGNITPEGIKPDLESPGMQQAPYQQRRSSSRGLQRIHPAVRVYPEPPGPELCRTPGLSVSPDQSLAWNFGLDMDQLLLRLNGGLRRRVLLEPRLHLEVPFPDSEGRRINNQLHQEGGQDAADHRGSDTLHHVPTRSNRPHDWKKPEEHARHGHDFWPQPFHCTMDDGFPQIVPAIHQALADRIVVGEIEVQQHENRRFRVHA